MKIVKIEWNDHHSFSDWMTLQEIQEAEDVLNSTVGFLVEVTNDYYVVAGTFSLESASPYSSVTKILRATVQNYTEI